MFKSPEESQAWSTFFAAQCPRFVNPAAKTNPKEVEVAAKCADLMLDEWRTRQSVPTVTRTEETTEDAPAKEPAAPKRGRQRRTEAPAPEKKEEEKILETGNVEYGTGDGETYR